MFNKKDNTTMFDRDIVEGIQQRHELRVRDVQSKVSVQFDGLKRFGRDLWKVQVFEELIFGKVHVPYDLLNTYITEMKLPKFIKSVKITGNNAGDIFINICHNKHGLVRLTVDLKDVIITDNYCCLKFALKNWEMPDVSWFVRKLVQVGFMMTGLEISALNKALPLVSFKKDEEGNYILDFTNIIKDNLDERKLTSDILRIINWDVMEDRLALQISLSSEKLIKYLKRKMPILFD